MANIATIEKGTTEYIAHLLLEDDMRPFTYVPAGIYWGVSMSSEDELKRAVQGGYPGIEFVPCEDFNVEVTKRAQEKINFD